jgi:transposase InsO family protein
MPWKETDKMDEKKEFIFRCWNREETFTEICRKFGISTKTGYKWLSRFKERGAAGLEELSRAPKDNANKVGETVKKRLLKLKEKHKYWGAYKILTLYAGKYPGERVPARSTVEELFKREGYTGTKRRARKKTEDRLQARVAAVEPNDVWTVDFKGWWWTAKGEKCLPLTVRDEAKKYILAIETPEKGDTAHVKAVFELLFREYGLPRFIRSDNGPPFGNVFNLWGLSRLSVWFMSLGIKIDLDDPGCPYQNGGHERMHRDMKKELQGKINGDMKDHQKEFDKWRNEFNHVRPHEALGMKRPCDVYTKSPRRWNGTETEQEYSGKMKTRMVNDRGFFNLRQSRIFMGNPFAGYYVGIKELPGEKSEIWFNDFLMGELDEKTGQITPFNASIN